MHFSGTGEISEEVIEIILNSYSGDKIKSKRKQIKTEINQRYM